MENDYKTSDMKLVMALIIHGLKLKGIENDDEDYKRKVFTFIDSGKAKEIALKLFNQELRVDPLEWENIRDRVKSYLINESKTK